MVVKSEDIALLDFGRVEHAEDEELTIVGCRIGKLSLATLVFEKWVTIEDCIIEEMNLFATRFIGGLTFSGNIIGSEFWYEDGGHNEAAIEISANIFKGFVGSVDCQFGGLVTVCNNVFMAGCDWLLADGAGDNCYDGGYIFRDNVGRTDVYFWYYPLRSQLIEILNRSFKTVRAGGKLAITVIKDDNGHLCLKSGDALSRLDMFQCTYAPIDPRKVVDNIVEILSFYFRSEEAKVLHLPDGCIVTVNYDDMAVRVN